MKYQLIAFDFDGTLADTYPWFASVINGVADKFRFRKIDERDTETLRGLGPLKIIDYLGIPKWKVPRIARHLRSMMSRDVSQISLFEGVEPLLKSLSESGVKIAIVSSNSYHNISRVLGPDILSYVDFNECGISMLGKVSKLKKLIKKGGFNADDTIYIGDEVRDIDAAKKASLRSGAVSWGYNCIEKLKELEPDEVFLNVEEIADVVCEELVA